MKDFTPRYRSTAVAITRPCRSREHSVMVNDISIAILSVCLLAKCSIAEEKTKFVKLSKAEYDAMDVIGAYEITDLIKLDLGPVYVGDVKSGLVKLKNPTNTDIQINAVKSSCGCSAIFPSSRVITAGEEMELAVRIKGTRPGAIGATLTIETDVQDYLIRLSARGRPAFELVSPEAVAREGVSRFAIRLIDPRLQNATTQVFIDGSECKLINRNDQIATFEHHSGDKETLILFPRFNSVEFPRMQLRVSTPGRYRLATPSVFGAFEDGKHRFRLLVLGNPEIKNVSDKTTVSIDGKPYDAIVKRTQRGKLLHIAFELETIAEGQTHVRLGEADLSFLLRQLP